MKRFPRVPFTIGLGLLATMCVYVLPEPPGMNARIRYLDSTNNYEITTFGTSNIDPHRQYIKMFDTGGLNRRHSTTMALYTTFKDYEWIWLSDNMTARNDRIYNSQDYRTSYDASLERMTNVGYRHCQYERPWCKDGGLGYMQPIPHDPLEQAPGPAYQSIGGFYDWVYYTTNFNEPDYYNQTRNQYVEGILGVDHGACSLGVDYKKLLAQTLPDQPYADFFNLRDDVLNGFQARLKYFQAAPWIAGDAQSGGISFRVAGEANGRSIVDIFNIGLDTLPGWIPGADVVYQNVRFDVIAEVKLGMDSNRIFTVTPNRIRGVSSNTGSCTVETKECCVLGVCAPCGVQFPVCVAGKVRDEAVKNAKTAITYSDLEFKECQNYPVSPKQDQSFQSCNADTECTNTAAGAVSLKNFLTGLVNTSPGGLLTNTLYVPQDVQNSDVGKQWMARMQAEVNNNANYRCGPITPTCAESFGTTATKPGSKLDSPIFDEYIQNRSAGKVCQFKLKPKRINYMPDKLEFVWFDSDAFDPSDVTSARVLGFLTKSFSLPSYSSLCTNRSLRARSAPAQYAGHLSTHPWVYTDHVY